MKLYSVFRKFRKDGKNHHKWIQTFNTLDDAQTEKKWREEMDEGIFVLISHNVVFK